MTLKFPDPVVESTDLSIKRAILETLAYSDVFDFPLRLEELHRYLPIMTTCEALRAALIVGQPGIATQEGYYFLAGHGSTVRTRARRERISGRAFRRAIAIGSILGKLPFVRMVALTGSLAVMDSEVGADLDYMLVAAPGRVWTARGFAVLLGRFAALLGSTLCPNLILSERALEWTQRDIYAAREICQMIPISGPDTYIRFRRANAWTNDYLPNAAGAPPLTRAPREADAFWKSAAERVMRGRLGGRVEAWEMNRKIERFTHEARFGTETRFNADMCQGNFDHHGLHTRVAWRQRMAELGLEPSSPPERS